MFLLLFLISFCLGENDKIVNKVDMAMDKMHHWLINSPIINSTGELVSSTNIDLFKSLTHVTSKDSDFRGWDDEAFDAINNFFWLRANGLVLEMGALDGKQFSISSDFLRFNWHRVLIEATPKFRHVAKDISPDATFIGAAICNVQSIVHYLIRPSTDNAINGIAEFMSPNFLRIMHPKIYDDANINGNFNLSNVNWDRFKHIHHHAIDSTIAHPIYCLPMNKVLKTLNISKINLFVLDIEGGELEVLKSINFKQIIFDVLCIETEKINRPDNYIEQIHDLLGENNYELVFQKGRNSWFKHKKFIPSSNKQKLL